MRLALSYIFTNGINYALEIRKAEKMATTKEVISKFGRKDTDTGSSEVQIALLTERIAEITGHMQSHKKDNSTRRGLMAMVNNRKKLLKYLSNTDHAKFVKIATDLNIRGQIQKQQETKPA
jgi:small subunit ribosomal protein S15